MKIYNKSNGSQIAHSVVKADNFRTRMVGLLDRKQLNAGEALIITQCNSIHMFFMRFSIDAIFVDKADKVVGLVQNIKPFMLSPIFFKASYVIEIPAGLINQTGTSKGDVISFS